MHSVALLNYSVHSVALLDYSEHSVALLDYSEHSVALLDYSVHSVALLDYSVHSVALLDYSVHSLLNELAHSALHALVDAPCSTLANSKALGTWDTCICSPRHICTLLILFCPVLKGWRSHVQVPTSDRVTLIIKALLGYPTPAIMSFAFEKIRVVREQFCNHGVLGFWSLRWEFFCNQCWPFKLNVDKSYYCLKSHIPSFCQH